jgi:hypothetical protein
MTYVVLLSPHKNFVHFLSTYFNDHNESGGNGDDDNYLSRSVSTALGFKSQLQLKP